MRAFFYITLLLTALSCSEDVETSKNYIVKPDGSVVYKSEGVELTLLEEEEQGDVKNFEGVSFVFKDVRALDYLARTGNSPSAEDEKALQQESVFMLELVGHKPSGSIFENSAISLNEDDATKYLIGDIQEDFVVVQNDKKYHPQGVQYDGRIGTGQKIRVAFFMEGINLNLPYTIEYYDRLFGKGLIKMTRKNTDIIS